MQDNKVINDWDDEVVESINKETKNKTKPVEIRFKIRMVNNILRVTQLKENLEKHGQSLNKYIFSLLIKDMEEKEKKSLFRNLKEDMFYSFNKAIYARSAPFSAMIIKEIDKVKIKQNIIDKKLDMILNILVRDEKTNVDELKNPTTKLLMQSSYFENLYTMLDDELKVDYANKKVAIEKTMNRYKKYNDFEEREMQEDSIFDFEYEKDED